MKNAFTWLRITFCSFAALLTLVSCQNATDGSGGNSNDGGNIPKPTVEKYIVVFNADIFHEGKLTAKVDGKETRSGDKVERSKIVEFTAQPENGKTVDRWFIEGGNFEAGSGSAGSDTARVKVSNNIRVHVSFRDIEAGKHIVRFGIEGSAGESRLTAAVAGGTAIVSGNEVSDGSIVEFTARTENGKTVDRWFIEGGSFEAGSGIAGSDTARVKVSGNISVRVSFKDADPHKRIVTFGIEGNAGENGITAAVAGGTTIVSGNEVSDGAFVEFTAVPAPGYKAKSWTIVKTEDKSPLTFEEGGTKGSLRAKAKAACNLTVKVEFERIVYTVVFTVPGGHGTLTAQKNWQNFETGGNAVYGDSLTFIAAAEEGYKLKSWTIMNTDDNSPVPFETGTNYDGKPYVSVRTTCNLTVKTEFEKCEYTITFAVEGEHGSVTAKKEDGSDFTSGSKAFYGEELLFTAVPDTDYKVREWTVNGKSAGTDTVYRLTVTNDVTVSVKFKGTLSITLHGDERIDEVASGYIDIAKGKTWAQVKTQMEAALILKSVWQGGDYGTYQWKLNDENGIPLDDTYTFTDDTTVYAVTNYLKFKTDGTALTGYNGERPRGRIILSGTITDIYESAFKDCTGITAVDFSACTNLMIIDKYAFRGCTGITGEVKLPPGLLEIGDSAFFDCTEIQGLNFSACTNLIKIDDGAFSFCRSLTGLDFSACTNLAILGKYAFHGCTGITGEVKLPPGLTEIGQNVFEDTSLEELDFSACTHFTKLTGGVFFYLKSLKKLILPASLTEITDRGNNIYGGAFAKCTELESINFSTCTNLTKIGYDAFRECTSLTELDFSACTSLTEITSYAFSSCTSLRTVKLSPNLIKCTGDSFSNCTSLEELDFSVCTSLTEIRDFSNRNSLRKLILPASLAKIDESAFSHCEKLITVNFSSATGLTQIKRESFAGCKRLTNVDLSACTGLTDIEYHAFSDCIMAEIKLPESITQIGSAAFGSNSPGVLCTKKVKIKGGSEFDRIKALVVASGYPENRIEEY